MQPKHAQKRKIWPQVTPRTKASPPPREERARCDQNPVRSAGSMGQGRSGSKATEPNLTTNGQAPKPCPGYLPLQGFCKPPFSSNSWTLHQSPEWRDVIESHASSFPCQLNLTIKPFLFSKAGATVLAYMQIWAASPLLDNKTLFSILLCIYLEQSKL